MINQEKVQSFLSSLSGDDVFLQDAIEGKQYTYNDFWVCVQKIASKLRLWQEKQIVACLDNSFLLCALYFACAAENLTIIPVDPQKSEQEVQKICESHAGAAMVGVEKNCTKRMFLQEALKESCSFESSAEELFGKTDFEKPFLITYTSGSTGTPKGVVHSLGNLIRSAASFRDAVGYRKGDVMYHCMPMTYMAGILNTIVLPFISCCGVVIGRRFSVMESIHFWKNIEKYGVNCFWMAPAMLRMILAVDKKQRGKEALTNKDVRFSVGTAPLDSGLRKIFENAYGVHLYQSYGLSETLFLTSQTVESASGDQSVGRLLDGVRMKVEADGEAAFAVPWMFLGYWNRESGISSPGKWYLTGDLVTGTEKSLHIKGRKKDLIIKGGINLNPHDIEQCILKNVAVEQCVVQGIEEHGEERIVCWYVGRSNEELTKGQINSILSKELGNRYQLDDLVRMDDLPKNLNGKIDKLRLLKEWKEQHNDR